MFNLGGAMNALRNAAGMAGGNVATPKVGWQNPSSYWTPERMQNQARNNAGAPGAAMPQATNGGTEFAFTGPGSGAKVGGGYNDFAGGAGSRPRASRTAMASLQRTAARGNPGWKAGGYQ
jgi:hypothetical protein